MAPFLVKRKGTVMSRTRICVAAVLVLSLGLAVLYAATSDTPTIPTFPPVDFSQTTPLWVMGVIDGDTIAVREVGALFNVRLIGIDTPETVHPSKPVQRYGKEASLFTTNLLKGEKVYLVYEGERQTVDKYGRVLAYVYRAPDGLFVNAEIIRQGYGHAYMVYPFKYMEKFRRLEQFARQAMKGLWAPEEKTETTSAKPPVVAPPVVRPKPKPTIEPQPKPDVTVYVTRTGKKYHRGSCGYLRKSRIPMKLKDAKAAGYGACSRCGPPN